MWKNSQFPMRAVVAAVVLVASNVLWEGCHGFSIRTTTSSTSTSSVRSRKGRFEFELGMSTWSNGQAIQEYKDFLESGKQEIEMKPDGQSIIVTDDTDRLSPLVKAMVSMGGNDDWVVPFKEGGASEDFPDALGKRTEYPIYVCVSPPNLVNFIKNMPEQWKSRSADLVFFSGTYECGNIEYVLKKFGFARDSMTQCLIGGFTMPDNGMGRPRDISCKIGLDALGEEKWAGECGTCGKWAGAFHERLYKNGIRCRTGFYREWRRWMWERSLYDGALNLVGAVRNEPVNLAEIALYYDKEVSDMGWQFSQQVRGYLAVTVTYGFEERMFGFAEREGHTTVAQLPSKEMYPFIYGLPPFEGSKKVVEYLNYAQRELGLLEGITGIPQTESFAALPPSKMRQGNLRSNGGV